VCEVEDDRAQAQAVVREVEDDRAQAQAVVREVEEAMKPPSYHIQVLDRAFQTLDALAGHPLGLGVTELAAQLHLHKSTAHRIAMVLESARFIEKEAASGKYHLGPRLAELGRAAVARLDAYDIARPHLRALAAETGETAHLGVLSGGEVVSVVHAHSNQTLTTPITVGARTPLHCSSIGKAILAFAPEHEVAAWLDTHQLTPYTKNTIRTRRRFREDLKFIRTRGYSLDNEEREEGLRCIGAPVYDSSGAVVAAISIAGPVSRVSSTLAPVVKNTAARISSALGYAGTGDAHAPARSFRRIASRTHAAP
jgi:IclR family KDG regulon transcriptional repressor